VERAIFAVAAAFAAVDVEEVPTVTVTAVMQRIKALHKPRLAWLGSWADDCEEPPRLRA
jgi:hypothetical protein